MKLKTILIIILTAIITIILMKNTDSVEFWVFGIYEFPKLAILAVMFLAGILVGLYLGRSGKKKNEVVNEYEPYSNPNEPDFEISNPSNTSTLSQEDQDYIK